MSVIKIFREGNIDFNQIVYFTLSGAAVLGTDYNVTFLPGSGALLTGSNGQISILAGRSYVEFLLEPIADNADEVAETIIVKVTGGNPSISTLPQNSSCLFVIKNDDSTLTSRVVGATLSTTPLIGVIAAVGGSPFTSTNLGVAPMDCWPTWLNGAATGRIDVTCTAAPVLPFLLKTVIRSPINSAPTGTTINILQNSVPGNFRCSWVAKANGTWELQFWTTTNATPFEYFEAIPKNTWHDIIWEFNSAGCTGHLDGGFLGGGQSFTTLPSTPTNVWQLFYYSSGMAYFSTVNNLANEIAMSPITPENA